MKSVGFDCAKNVIKIFALMLDLIIKINIIIYMETEKLTLKILSALDPKTILYAEFAEGGAMGAAGTARIYTLEKKKPHFYLVDITGGEEEQVKVYSELYTMLKDFSKKGKYLMESYDGYGNHTYKAKLAVFRRDDDECAFIYYPNPKDEDEEIAMPVSCAGVYFKVAGEFAERFIEPHFLYKYLKKIRKAGKISDDEMMFFQTYVKQVERTDKGQPELDIDVSTYWDAIMYLKYLSHEKFNVNDETLAEGLEAIQKYRLKLVAEKIGWRNLDEFFYRFVKDKMTMLFVELDKVVMEVTMDPFQAEVLAESASENPSEAILRAQNIKNRKRHKRYFHYKRAKIISNRDDSLAIKSHSVFRMADTFKELSYVASSQTNLDAAKPNCITELFEYPVIVKFTDAAHRKIMRNVMDMDGAGLMGDAVAIGYYLADYIFNEDTLSYADVLPVATHIVEVLPPNDPYHTKTPELLWLAGEIIDRTWRCLEETEEKQKKFRGYLFELYAPRVGGVWPIAHCNEFKFNDPAAERMFNEALSFLMSIDDLTERSGDLKAYMEAYENGLRYPAPAAARRAFVEHCKKMSPKDRFAEILKVCEPREYSSYLNYPENKEEADILLAEIFRTDKTATLVGIVRLGIIEQLLLTPNTIGVGEHILKYLVDNFDKLVEIVEADTKKEQMDFFDAVSTIFTAAASGVTEENEFPPLNELAKKIRKLSIMRATEQAVKDPDGTGVGTVLNYNPVETVLDDALKCARKRRRMILFQRSALQQLF